MVVYALSALLNAALFYYLGVGSGLGVLEAVPGLNPRNLPGSFQVQSSTIFQMSRSLRRAIMLLVLSAALPACAKKTQCPRDRPPDCSRRAG